MSLDWTVPLFHHFSTFPSKIETFTVLTSYPALPPHFVFPFHHNCNMIINNKEEQQDSFFISYSSYSQHCCRPTEKRNVTDLLTIFWLKEFSRSSRARYQSFHFIHLQKDNIKNQILCSQCFLPYRINQNSSNLPGFVTLGASLATSPFTSHVFPWI